MFSESLQQLAFYNRLFQLAVYLIFFALHLAHFDIFSAFDVSFYNKQSTSELRFLPRIAFHSKHKLSFVDFLHFFEFHYRVLYALLFFVRENYIFVFLQFYIYRNDTRTEIHREESLL